MSEHLPALLGLGLRVVLTVTVLGTVKRRERLAFVPGVLLVIGSMTLLSGLTSGLLAVLGLALVFASTVPMLVE